jgi:hypothetical protein
MKKKGLNRTACTVFILFSLLTIFFTTSPTMAFNVTLAWDAVDGDINGYKVFARESGQSYNYSDPVWQGTAATCRIDDLEDQTDYYFVVRAYTNSATSSNSNEVFYPADDTDSSDSGVLASKFAETTLTSGIEYYTDRSYQLTSVASFYDDMEAIITPNDDRNRTDASGYLTFTMPYDGTVYVAYDSRATSLPNWMNGFIDTGDVIETSLSTQPYLNIYSRAYEQGDIVNLGANKATGFVGDTVSNYIVFYSDGSGGVSDNTDETTSADSSLAGSFEESSVATRAYLYTDRSYYIKGGIPNWMIGRTLIQTPNDERYNSASSGYINFINTVDWWVYVLFDSRSASIPNWLEGWELRSDYRIYTSLSTQPYLKVYRKLFDAGEIVDLGGNYGPGASDETRSNYVVVYGK